MLHRSRHMYAYFFMVSSPVSNVPLKRRQSSHNKIPLGESSVRDRFSTQCANYSTVNTPLLTYLLTYPNRHRQSKFTLLLSLNYINETIVGNGAPSGPNCLLFSDVDRLPDALRDRSKVGSRLGRMRRRLELPRVLWIEKLSDLCSSPMSGWGPVLICMHRWKPRRMRCRRLPTSTTDPMRPPGDLRLTN